MPALRKACTPQPFRRDDELLGSDKGENSSLEFLQLLNKWGTLLHCSDEPPAPANPLPAAPLLIQALTSLFHHAHWYPRCIVAALSPDLAGKLTGACSPEAGLTCRGRSHLLMACPEVGRRWDLPPEAGRRWDLPPLAHAPESPQSPECRVPLSLLPQWAGLGEHSHLAAPMCE